MTQAEIDRAGRIIEDVSKALGRMGFEEVVLVAARSVHGRGEVETIHYAGHTHDDREEIVDSVALEARDRLAGER